MVAHPGNARRSLSISPLRLPGTNRLRRPRSKWHLEDRSYLRSCLGSNPCLAKLGAVQRRSLGLGGSLGLDVGRQLTFRIRDLALRPMGAREWWVRRWRLGLGSAAPR